MLKRRVPRVLVTGFLLAVTVSGLSACRTSPSVAAYVGDEQVTVAELDAAVARRLENEDIAAVAEGNEEEFTRRVLTLLVEEEVYAAAADRYDVAVGNDEVRATIAERLGSNNPDDVYRQYAQQGISREDIFENVRQQLLRQEVAAAEGKAEGLDAAALRARYADVRDSLATVSLGYITVPDAATADAVLAQLTASPESYASVAAQYPGPATLPAMEALAPDKIPPVLADGVATAAPDTGFTTAVPQVNGVVVTFVGGTVTPTFEETRPQLEQEASAAVDQAGTSIVGDFRTDLGVKVNPRFGVLEDGKIVAGSGGVVDILKDAAATASAADPATPAPATPAG